MNVGGMLGTSRRYTGGYNKQNRKAAPGLCRQRTLPGLSLNVDGVSLRGWITLHGKGEEISDFDLGKSNR